MGFMFVSDCRKLYIWKCKNLSVFLFPFLFSMAIENMYRSFSLTDLPTLIVFGGLWRKFSFPPFYIRIKSSLIIRILIKKYIIINYQNLKIKIQNNQCNNLKFRIYLMCPLVWEFPYYILFLMVITLKNQNTDAS